MKPVFLLALLLAAPGGTQAAEIRVLSAGAAKSTLTAVIADFERTTGHTVRADYEPAQPLGRRVRDGETVDVLITSTESLDALASSGTTVGETRRVLGTIGVGVAIRAGFAFPDIRTEKAFRETLIKARAIAAINPERGTGGRHFASVLERLGIADIVKTRLILLDGGSTAELVARGDAEIAVQQMSELIGVPGTTVVGPFPAALQKETAYAAIVLMSSRNPAAAREFISYLGGADVGIVLRYYGFKLPQ